MPEMDRAMGQEKKASEPTRPDLLTALRAAEQLQAVLSSCYNASDLARTLKGTIRALAHERVVEDTNASDAEWWRRLRDWLVSTDRELLFSPVTETFEIRDTRGISEPPDERDAPTINLPPSGYRTSTGEDVERVRRYVLANGSGEQWPIARDAMSRVLDAYEHERARLQSLRDTFKHTSVIRSEDGIVIAPQRFDELHRLVEAAP